MRAEVARVSADNVHLATDSVRASSVIAWTCTDGLASGIASPHPWTGGFT